MSTPTRVDVHPSGKTVEFYESDHRYCMPEVPECEFTSATTWISRFFPTFDREQVSADYAKRNGLSQQEVIANWEQKAKLSRERGTLVHERAERAIAHFLSNGTHLASETAITGDSEDAVAPLVLSMLQAVKRMSEVLDFLSTERIVASPAIGLSGMVDLVVRLRVEDRAPTIGLYDWKTNAKIELNNRWQRGLEPVEELDHCNFNHYSLQLNLYEYLCRTEGYYPEDTRYQKVLIHLAPEGYTTYKCPDMQPIIKKMLEHAAPAVQNGQNSH